MKRLLLLAAWMAFPTLAAAQTPSETVEYYGADAIGSIRIVFAPDGTVLGRQDYGPFGRELFAVPPLPADRFGGNQADDEAQQAYFHARQFQARTGRFASVDPMFAGLFEPQAWNRYTYAQNNPIRYVDPNGLCVVAGFCQSSNPACDTFDCDGSTGDMPGGVGNGGLDNDGMLTAPGLDPGDTGGGTTGSDPGKGNPAADPTDDPTPKPRPSPPVPHPPGCDPGTGTGCGPSVTTARLRGFLSGAWDSCMVTFIHGTVEDLVPISPSITSGIPAASQFAAQWQMNRALAYAASRTNVIGTRGLLMPFKSRPFATMFRLSETIAGAGATVAMEVLAIGDGLRKEWEVASSGLCK